MKSCIDSKLTSCGTNSSNVNEKLEKADERLKIIRNKVKELRKRNISLEELFKEIKNEVD